QSEFHVAVVASTQAIGGSIEPAKSWARLWLQALHKQFAEVHVVEHVVSRSAEDEFLALAPGQAEAFRYGHVGRKVSWTVHAVSSSGTARPSDVEKRRDGIWVKPEQIGKSVLVGPGDVCVDCPQERAGRRQLKVGWEIEAVPGSNREARACAQRACKSPIADDCLQPLAGTGKEVLSAPKRQSS